MKTAVVHYAYFVVISVLSLVSCTQQEHISFSNLNETKIIEILPKYKNTVGASFKFTGCVDCTTEFALQVNNSGFFFKNYLLEKGEIDTIFNYDWYNEPMTIKVEGKDCSEFSNLNLVVSFARVPL